MTPDGPADDRVMMIVDENGKFVSQRGHPKMSLIRIEPSDQGFLVDVPGVSTFQIHNDTSVKEEVFDCRIWKDEVKCVRVSPKLSEALSEYLGFEVHVVKLAKESPRQRVRKPEMKNYNVQFPDSAPLLMCNLTSLKEINHNIDENLDINRFRPNIIARFDKPFIEENLGKIMIGDLEVTTHYPCDRCIMIDLDQEQGVKTADAFKKITRYQKKHATFGIRMIPDNQQTIRIGDTIRAEVP